MSNSTVINLREARRVDPGRWLTGPLRAVQLVALGPAEQREIRADSAEHTVFVLHGIGQVTSGDTTVATGPDVAITLPLGTRITLVAGREGLEYFQASLQVPDARTAQHDDRQGGAR